MSWAQQQPPRRAGLVQPVGTDLPVPTEHLPSGCTEPPAQDQAEMSPQQPPQGMGCGSRRRLVPQFPRVPVCRLLASQLQEEKQQHEEEVERLHLDIRSLKRLSRQQAALIQQQAALIQDLQQRQGQELQHNVLWLKENWVRGQGRQDWVWGWLPPPVLLPWVGVAGGAQLREAG